MDVNPKSRRRHSAEFKAEVVAACAEPGATVAAVARAFGLNDNLVHDWRRGRSGAGASKTIGTSLQESAPEFVALSLPSSSPPPAPAPAVAPEGIRLEFKRGAIGVNVTWPISAAADCAAWLREVLR
ncbi:Transposase [compost metagenome]